MAVLRRYVASLFLALCIRRPDTLLADNQDKLTSDFQFIFTALTQLGHDPNAMIDCSEVVPAPKPFNGQATFPAGKTAADVEQAVSAPFAHCAVPHRKLIRFAPVRLDPLPIARYRTGPGYLCRLYVSSARTLSKSDS